MEKGRAERFASVAETHAGVVYFAGDRAYKLKKPVSLGFLDFTRRATRQAVCHREVELNRRLAPDVYLGVADVVGPEGAPCDHLVVMRRLPAERRLATFVASGDDARPHLEQLARILAAFHARALRSPEIDEEATAEAMRARWEANATNMAHLVDAVFDRDVVQRVGTLARRYLSGRRGLFATRLAAGRACDGHGDLLADDIFCLDDGPRVLDCLEFDDRLRYADVLADIAFLAMDLERLGRPDLSAAFLDHYRHVSGDTWPVSLAHHYVAYRAQVRALVAGLRAEQGDQDSLSTARRLLALAADHLETGRVRLIVVGGAPGSGKSTLAALVGRALDAVVVRSDEVRKELAGVDPGEPQPAPYGQGLYTKRATRATYEDMLRRARIELNNGVSVILDATFGDPAWRVAARELAGEAVADLDELRCDAPAAVREQRLARRASCDRDPSDVTVDVARELAANEAPWPSATAVDTSGTTDRTWRAVAEQLRLDRSRA